MDSDYRNRMLNLGVQALEDKNFKKALLYFDKIIEDDPYYPDAYRGKAYIYYHQGEKSNYLSALEKAASLGDKECGKILHNITSSDCSRSLAREKPDDDPCVDTQPDIHNNTDGYEFIKDPLILFGIIGLSFGELIMNSLLKNFLPRHQLSSTGTYIGESLAYLFFGALVYAPIFGYFTRIKGIKLPNNIGRITILSSAWMLFFFTWIATFIRMK
ncbi:tetratricopeptide repeat protein [Oceanidesulfovibrio marinus]|uniref:Uncharacterized protein n=1 Tax=Oceanidesulfovibrio marinus TaxID=370038 RepID=A0A6P1ZK16_9BACT|nr:hypothetical protein [Oceanidesulfovibrio marinus]TVM35660.1 hypothetical protein DQK91_03055 [Oceanidesulfovibrio marinus]